MSTPVSRGDTSGRPVSELPPCEPGSTIDGKVRYRLVCADGSHHLAIDQDCCGPHHFEPMGRDEKTRSFAEDMALRATRSASFAKLFDDMLVENAQLRREAMQLRRDADARADVDGGRDNLLRALAKAVRSNDLTRARALADQETTT